jgi:hypothetical protein
MHQLVSRQLFEMSFIDWKRAAAWLNMNSTLFISRFPYFPFTTDLQGYIKHT